MQLNMLYASTMRSPMNHLSRQHFFSDNKKGSHTTSLKGHRQRPILPGRVQPSTFGTGELNYCVRYGNRWDLSVITTGRFSGRVSVFPFRSASFLLSFRSARSPHRFRSFPNPQPAVTCFSSLGLLPFVRSPCSVPRSSASFPFPSGPLPAFRLSASLPFPSLSASLRFPQLSLRSSGCFQLCTFQCTLTTAQIRFNTSDLFTIDLFVSFDWHFCLSGLLYQALESSPRPISINNLHALPHFQR